MLRGLITYQSVVHTSKVASRYSCSDTFIEPVPADELFVANPTGIGKGFEILGKGFEITEVVASSVAFLLLLLLDNL